MTTPLFHVEHLSKIYPHQKKEALSDLYLTIYPQEIVGIIGESGSGKSTLGKLLLGLENPSAGKIWFQGKPLESLNHVERKTFRRETQMIFQNPYASLNPRMQVRDIITEPFLIHKMPWSEEELQDLLHKVDLPPAFLERYPHTLSGGQRQRINIARALALRPSFLLCDEPISALDVPTGMQILTLLEDLHKHLAFTLVFISHDLRAIARLTKRTYVLYQGKIVEENHTELLYASPQNPYTQHLLGVKK